MAAPQCLEWVQPELLSEPEPPSPPVPGVLPAPRRPRVVLPRRVAPLLRAVVERVRLAAFLARAGALRAPVDSAPEVVVDPRELEVAPPAFFAADEAR